MQKIMDTSLDIICTLDEEGYFLSINKACKRVWGYNPKDLIGTNYLYLVFKDDVELTKISAEAVSSGEKIVNFENRYVHKNGTIVPMLWSSNWDEKDRIYYCIARDNTEKKKAIEQLENSERRYKTLVQEGSDMICIVDEKAVFSYASPTSTKILNITPEELNEPSIKGIVVNSKEVTTKVQHLKAIEEQNAQLKKIAWTQSHIVRAPVARLMGLIDLLKDDKEKLKPEEKERILNYIITSADEIDHVIKDIVENTINAIDLDEIT